MSLLRKILTPVLCSKDEGKWSGITGYAESGFTDIVFGGYAFYETYNMIMEGKLFLEKDFLASVLLMYNTFE